MLIAIFVMYLPSLINTILVKSHLKLLDRMGKISFDCHYKIGHLNEDSVFQTHKINHNLF
jgi:hypothetical protein